MHSRIFQLEEKQQNCSEHPLESYDLENTSLESRVDYIVDSENTKDDIKWFIGSLINFKDYFEVISNNDKIISIEFKKGFKEKYFEKRLKDFKKMANRMEMDSFIDSYRIFSLKELLEETLGFYIYGYREGVFCLDCFIRELPDENITYYFGETLDYHF